MDALVIVAGIWVGLFVPSLTVPGVVAAGGAALALKTGSRRLDLTLRGVVWCACLQVLLFGFYGLPSLFVMPGEPLQLALGMTLASSWLTWVAARRSGWLSRIGSARGLRVTTRSVVNDRREELEGVLHALWPLVECRLAGDESVRLAKLQRPRGSYRARRELEGAWALPCRGGVIDVRLLEGRRPCVAVELFVEGLDPTLTVRAREEGERGTLRLSDPVFGQLLAVSGVEADVANRLLAEGHRELLPVLCGHGAELAAGALRARLGVGLPSTEIVSALEALAEAGVWLRERLDTIAAAEVEAQRARDIELAKARGRVSGVHVVCIGSGTEVAASAVELLAAGTHRIAPESPSLCPETHADLTGGRGVALLVARADEPGALGAAVGLAELLHRGRRLTVAVIAGGEAADEARLETLWQHCDLKLVVDSLHLHLLPEIMSALTAALSGTGDVLSWCDAARLHAAQRRCAGALVVALGAQEARGIFWDCSVPLSRTWLRAARRVHARVALPTSAGPVERQVARRALLPHLSGESDVTWRFDRQPGVDSARYVVLAVDFEIAPGTRPPPTRRPLGRLPPDGPQSGAAALPVPTRRLAALGREATGGGRQGVA